MQIVITSLTYDQDKNLLSATCDFSALGDVSTPVLTVIMEPEAIGNRIAVNGYANGEEALDAIMLEHAARIAPTISGVTVNWLSPSDEEKSARLDALADRIEAARVFFSNADPGADTLVAT